MDVKVGDTVAVFDARSGKIFVGIGKITSIEPLELENGYVIIDNYVSEIVLENGVKTEGAGCWWHIVDEETANKLRPDSKPPETAKKLTGFRDRED